MKDNTNYKVTDNLAVLLVADPKCGKTRLAMSFPDPYFLDLDKNLGSAVRVAGNKKYYYDQVDVDDKGQPVSEDKQWERATTCLEAACKDPRIKTIVIDSVTRLGELAKVHIIAQLKSMGLGNKLRADTASDQIRLVDYDTYGTLLLKLVALTRASGKMVVWTSHQTAHEDEVSHRMRYFLSIVGKLKDTLGGYFTDVWAMTATPETKMIGGKAVQSTKYEIRTKPTGFHVSLGTSLDLEPSIDITDRTPDQIWAMLAPKLSTNPTK